jgi:uncharacterized protein
MEPEYSILVFSDMHGNRRVIDMAKRILEKNDYDMVVYLGDFSEKMGDDKANIEDAESMISALSDLAELKMLFGNCDSQALRDFLVDQKVSFHDELFFKGKSALVGRGGSHPTPFHTPSEFSEFEIEKSLKKILDAAAARDAEKLILFTHEPPSNTKADQVSGGNVGSGALRHIIETYQPNLNVCGHIHESKSIDHIKGTTVINVGQASNGHFLKLRVDGDITTEEINI